MKVSGHGDQHLICLRPEQGGGQLVFKSVVLV
jgi:hypothetical protein